MPISNDVGSFDRSRGGVARITQCFERLRAEGRTALVAYLTIGDPTVEDSVRCALAALEGGADVLELGVPFSDPTADGPVIAAASYRAIQSGGSLKAALEVARQVRQHSAAPLVLFSYVNPVYAFGATSLPSSARDAGIDGLLLVDLPPEEGSDLRQAADEAQLAIVPLVAPTTGVDREPRILQHAKGFIYYVSVTGVTGSSQAPLTEAARAAAALRERARMPVVVGFGIDGPERAREVASAGVDGVVVGTAIVKAIAAAASSADRAHAVKDLVSRLRSGLDQRRS